jgi:hypothetical protein
MSYAKEVENTLKAYGKEAQEEIVNIVGHENIVMILVALDIDNGDTYISGNRQTPVLVKALEIVGETAGKMLRKEKEN